MRKRKIKTPLESFAVVTGTEAEYYYYLQMKKDCRYRNMIVGLCKADTLADFIIEAQKFKLKNRYSRVWAVASLKDYGKTPSDIAEEMHLARKKNVNLAYAYPSILLYFVLGFEIPPFNSGDEMLFSLLRKRYPNFEFTADYLLHEGTEFHLGLFKNKANAGINETEYNRQYLDSDMAKAINFTSFMNDVAENCGEGDISYNQKTIG